MSTQVYRQGDVALIPVEGLPDGAKPRQSRLIRRGEHGGLHVLERKADAQLFEFQPTRFRSRRGREPQLFVKAPTGARVVHGEHKPLALPAGLFEVRIQREDDRGSFRNVLD